MIRILHIHTLPVVSGSGINTFLSMQGMDRNVFDVELACAPGGDLIELVQCHGMKVRLFRNLVQPLDPARDVRSLVDLVRFLRKNSYHIVHTHNSKGGFIGRLAARLAGIPVIIHTVHGFAFHDQESPWKRYLYLTLERIASHWCDVMIFVSQPLIDWALREQVVGRRKIEKIYSGIQLDKFKPVGGQEQKEIRQRWGLEGDDVVIGIVSKLWEGKGHSVLIDAFAEIKRSVARAKLLIVGEGHLYDDLCKMARGRGVSSDVIFTGFQKDVAPLIAIFDVAVLPSFFEGMGRVLLEAMAMEKPVVASRVGGIPDVVEDGVTGILVSPGNANELARAIKKILGDRKLSREMGKAGRRKMTESFSADFMVKEINRVYRTVMYRKGITNEES